jgi:membrane protease YdiL (CAAX protease family)
LSNSHLLQAVGGIISLALFATSALVFTRVILRIRRDGGKVRSAGFGISEALAAFVLGSYFCLLIGQTLLVKKESPASPASPAIEETASDSIITTQLIPNSAFFIVLASGIAFYLRFARGLSLRETFGFDRVSPLKILGWAVGLVICAFPLIGLAAFLSQAALPNDDLTPQPLVQLFRDFAHQGNYRAVAAILVAAGVIAPVCEEFLFRGFFYGVGKRFLSPVPAGILTAILFAAFHLNLASLASLFVLAICLTLAYERTGSLFVPICMHALFNFTNLFFIFGQAQGWFPTQ